MVARRKTERKDSESSHSKLPTLSTLLSVSHLKKKGKSDMLIKWIFINDTVKYVFTTSKYFFPLSNYFLSFIAGSKLITT
jgi:hypothetical protein